MTDVADLLRFSEEVGNLKHVPRRGWILKGIQDPESVAVSREPASTFPSLSRLTCLAFLLRTTCTAWLSSPCPCRLWPTAT